MAWLQDFLAVHLAERVGEQLDAGAVGVAEVQRGAAFLQVGDPGLDLGPYAEVLGGLHHLAISVTPEKWAALRDNLDQAGVPYLEESGASLYFRDPDGARVELLADPLGEMYGQKVL